MSVLTRQQFTRVRMSGPPLSDLSSLKAIKIILKEKKVALETGLCRLTLPANTVEEIHDLLNSAYCHHDTQLEELIGIVQAIRIIPADEHSLNTSSVHLDCFCNVQHLEIQNVDTSYIFSLSKLRNQIHSLVLVSCVTSLKDVLLYCGGDKCTNSILWSKLHSLYITCCENLELDTSFQMSPWLKIVDLSSNSLYNHNIHSLNTLFGINSLMLNFNRLQSIPVLAPSAYSTLKVLQLRQNQLENLQGLEHLTVLEELDLAYNCISHSSALVPLSALSKLAKLFLECNPISFSKEYRILILQRVSVAINKKMFILDGQHLSISEKDVVGSMSSVGNSTFFRSHNSVYSMENPIAEVNQSLSQDENCASEETENLDCNSEFTKGNEEKSNAELQSRLSMSVKRRKGCRTREVEIVDVDIDANSSILEEHNSINNGEQHLTTKQRLEELRKTFGQENWLHSQAGSEVRQLLGWNDDFTSVVANEENISKPKDNKEPQQSCAAQLDETSSRTPKFEDAVETCITRIEHEDMSDDEGEALRHVFLVHHEEEGISRERLLTVGVTNICEKDVLNGSTLSSWKLTSLRSLLVLEHGNNIRVQLKFSPASQKNRERTYSMEENDFLDFQNLASKLLDVQTKSELNVNCLHCVKCGGEFPETKAALKLRTLSATNLQLFKEQLEECPVCPNCGSEIIFTVEHREPQIHSASINADTPVRKLTVDQSIRPTNSCGSSDVEVQGDLTNSADSECSVEVVEKSQFSAKEEPLNIAKTSSPFARPISIKSAASSQSPSSNSSQSRKKNQALSIHSLASSFVYSYADFTQVDHRLRLFCEMSVINHKSEEFLGLLKADLVTSTNTEHPVLLVVTSLKLYILSIIADQNEQPEKWLQKLSTHRIEDLCFIITVIGNQGFILQLGKDGAPELYLFLLRDERRTRNFLQFFRGILERSGYVVQLIEMNQNQWHALHNLILKNHIQEEEATKALEEFDSKANIFLLCMSAHFVSKEKQLVFHVNTALVVDNDCISLLQGDSRWLLSHKVHLHNWGVSVISTQQVVNLVSLESFVSEPEKIRLFFLDEASKSQEHWTLTLATREAVDLLVEAVRNPWEAAFSVELEINELDE